ncbi:MAG: metallophosphatase domain-containing protein [Rhodospirillales bacterium]|nr:metallophosphatase domain-containing protein [Rhodospirillales bacterium]
MRLVLLSDTHGLHREMMMNIPDGDLLVHAGDFCAEGEVAETRSFREFFRGLPHPHKVAITGNHDRCLEADPSLGAEIFAGCHYLLDSGVEIGGVTFRGSPWQPWFFDMGFNLERGVELREKWELIPAHVDVLITHAPPHGVLDGTGTGENVGCEELRAATRRTCPRLHVFGHIHQARGWERLGSTLHVNASNCAGRDERLNSVLVVVLPAGGDAVIATQAP